MQNRKSESPFSFLDTVENEKFIRDFHRQNTQISTRYCGVVLPFGHCTIYTRVTQKNGVQYRQSHAEHLTYRIARL